MSSSREGREEVFPDILCCDSSSSSASSSCGCVLLPQRQRVFSKPAISWYATEGIMATVEVQYTSTALDHDGVDLGVVIGSTKDAQLETAQEYPSPDHVTNGTYS